MNIENYSYKLCNLCAGIPLHIHAYFPFYVIFAILGNLASTASNGTQETVGMRIVLNIAECVILFITVLIHELGHCSMTMFLGGAVSKILLWPLGGLAYCGFNRNPKNQLLVSLAGPFVHIPLFFVFFVPWILSGECHNNYECGFSFAWIPEWSCFLHNIALYSMILQVSLFIFNLFIPCYPLDGGKIFICILRMCSNFSIDRIAVISIIISAICAVGMIGVAVWQFNSVAGSFGIFLGLWILWSVYQMYDYRKKGMIEEHPMFAEFDEPQVIVERTARGGYIRTVVRK